MNANNAALIAWLRDERRLCPPSEWLRATDAAAAALEAADKRIAALESERDALRQLLLEARDWFHPRDSKVPGALVDMCDRIDAALKEGKE